LGSRSNQQPNYPNTYFALRRSEAQGDGSAPWVLNQASWIRHDLLPSNHSTLRSHIILRGISGKTTPIGQGGHGLTHRQTPPMLLISVTWHLYNSVAYPRALFKQQLCGHGAPPRIPPARITPSLTSACLRPTVSLYTSVSLRLLNLTTRDTTF
jgi:hypothetical protein